MRYVVQQKATEPNQGNWIVLATYHERAIALAELDGYRWKHPDRVFRVVWTT